MGSRLQHLDIEITRRCNLSCPYCYLRQGEHDGTGDITDETLYLCLDLVGKFGRTSGKQATTINFYGGEPLLVPGKIELITTEAKRRGWQLKWVAVTNGTILTDRILAIKAEHGLGFARSIDGCPEALELSRPGIWDRYWKNTQVLKDYGHRRSTIVPQAAHLTYQSWSFLQAHGFRGWTPIPDSYQQWTEQQQREFMAGLWLIARDFVRDFYKVKSIPFYFFLFDKEIKGMRAAQSRNASHGCGAGRTMHCVSHSGCVYPCHRFATEPPEGDYCAGHVSEILKGTGKGYGASFREALRKVTTSCDPAKCRSCEARHACNGGCYHEHLKVSGDPSEPTEMWCRFRREARQCVQWIDSQLRDEFPRWWDQADRKVKRTGTRNTVPEVTERGTEKRCAQTTVPETAPTRK